MAYRPVLELSLAHPAVPGGLLPGTAIVPDRATAARLAGLRYLSKPVGERLVVIAETDRRGAPLVAISSPVPLGFAIVDVPPATDRAALADAPLFTDRRAGGAVPQKLRATEAKGAPRIELRLTPTQVGAALAGRVRRCVATLPAISARWCYHVVTDHSAPLADWRIVRGAGEVGPAPVFGDAGRAEVAAGTADDPAGAALVAALPGRRVLRFLSDEPVAATAAPIRGLELRVGETRLLAMLPNPPPDATGRIGAAPVLARTVPVITA